METKLKLKKDKYKSARGGYSRFLKLFCRKCDRHLLTYQKDGPGDLLRLYMDRIFYPENLVGLQKTNLREVEVLKCKSCEEIIGVPYVYMKEKRKSFRLFQGTVAKKIQKAS